MAAKNVPNTEYPWTDAQGHRTPAGATVFANRETVTAWVATAGRVSIELEKVAIAIERGPGTKKSLPR
jgi:hypothetical protein